MKTIINSYSLLSQLVLGLWQRLTTAFLIAGFIALSGCATAPSVAFFHGIGYCNAGDKTITFHKIQYGEVVQDGGGSHNFKGGMDKNCINSYGYSSVMPIPKTMIVEWQIEDGPRNRVDVPIRSLITSKHPVKHIKVRFNDEKMQILQINLDGLKPYLNATTVIFEQ